MKLGKFAQAAVVLEEATRTDPGDAQAWAHWATALAEEGHAQRALDCVDKALQIDPALAAAWTIKGTLLREMGRGGEAAQCFRSAVERGADRELNTFYLAALEGGSPPQSAPRGYVQALFDSYAEGFEEHLVEVLNYRAPQTLAAGLGDRRFAAVLDLGCGTGLMARQLHSRAARIVGVDLSQAMAERARQLRVYADVVQADALEYLDSCTERFDLVVAADVFNYIGELAPLFAAVKRVLEPGGVFAFTVELAADSATIALRRSMRYAHSRSYILSLAHDAGFQISAIAEHPIREDQGTPIPGLFAWLAAG
jgi:predicted TPR repeat methyltransferase